MSQTFSFDASLKLKGCDLKGFIKHFLREDDETKQHSNEQIDASRTHNNMTLVYDAQTDRMIPTRDAEQILQAIDNRLSDAIDLTSDTYKATGKKVRSDAVKVRGLIVQIDPEFYKEHKDDNKAMMKSYNDMLHAVQKQYGKKNIVAATVHLDETNPHMHIAMVPVTNDNRLSQKDFFDKVKLKEAHKAMRTELRSKGYDIDMNRRTPEHAHRLTEQQYKDLRDSVKKQAQLNDYELTLQHREQKVADDEKRLDDDKQQFEAYKANAMQDIEAQRQQTLHSVQDLYDKAFALHSKLLKQNDAYLKYAQTYGNELGSVKREITELSL